MTAAPGVTVGRLLQSRPDTLGLDLEILAGGLDRLITSLQLVGMDELDELEIEGIPDTGEEP
jgi:hypothetical protein